MLTRVASIRQWLQRRWLYPSIAVGTICTISLGQTQVSQAIPWWQLLIQGAQIVQISSMSDGQETNLGAQINQQLLSGQVKLYRNRAANDYVDRIGQRLARNSARPNIKYTFQVVVYVNTGLLKAADNEAQLAGVIGHEIGHITGRHSIQHMKQAAISQGISSALGVDNNQLVQLGAQIAMTLPNSRQDEYDADKRGLTTMIQSGYAPTAMPEFMKKLMRGNSPPEFLSSHPAVPERVANLQRMIPAGYQTRTDGLNVSTYKQQLRSFF
jgi:beta-barrel assembly-enhancing protease